MKAALILLLAFFLAMSATAQTGTSAITGTVTDPAGAAVAGAKVVVANSETGARVETLSNDAGVYRVPSLPPGLYTIEVESPGFDKTIRSGVQLAVSQAIAIDVALQLGKATESVTIESGAQLVESQSSSAGQLIGRKMVAQLPMPNRAATSLAALAPGVVMIDSGTGAENYPLFSVAGGRARNQNFTLDGGNVTNAVGLTRPQQMTSLPMDAMQEFRVISNNYAAEFGHSTGGIITLSTRSGTNEVHGSLFDYFRNDALDARNFFSAAKPPLRHQQFGGAIGGPIRKDKTHYFLSWEQTRERTSVPMLYTVPDLAQRTGDFSNLRDAAGNLIPIYDAATTVSHDRAQFPGNVIPASRLDPVARAVANYWPTPNRTGNAAGANNFGNNADLSLNRNIVVAKLDHQFRASDQVSARYYINDSGIENTGSFGRPEADPDAIRTDARIQSIMLSHTHAFRPSLINELKVSLLQRKYLESRFGAGEGLATAVGLQGVSGAAFPMFTLPGYASLSNSPGRTQTPIRDLQFLEALSRYRGKHAFKAGVEFRRGANDEVRDRSSAGMFGITPLITGKPGVSGTGNSMASFMLGEVNNVAVQVSDLIRSRAAYWAGYVQDDWRITDRLTLNYGLRWESEIPRRVADDRQNSFHPTAINPITGTPGIVTFAGVNGVSRQAFRTDTNNFGPRFGFAYRVPSGRETVLRGGGGVFYGPTVSNTIGDAASTGFSTALSLVVPQADLISAIRLRDGVPVYQRPALDAGFGAAAPGQRPYTSVGFFKPDQETPISYQFNLNVQREVARDVVAEVGYMSNISHHLTANDLTLNQVPTALMGAGDAQARRPFSQFSNVYWINPAIGNSTYHAGYVKAEKRFSRGLSFLAHYTFSKFIDDVASSVEYGDPSSYMDAYNRRLDKSLSGSDVPHRFIASALYEVPRWNGLLGAALGGWKLGGFATVQSGEPFTVMTLANTTNAFSAGPLRPDLVGDPRAGTSTLSRFFNIDAFRAAAQFRFGNSPRSVLRGANYASVDTTVEKEFPIRERYRFDLRAEFYNLLNHANFNAPGHTLGAADFGVVNAARPARAVQLGARLSF